MVRTIPTVLAFLAMAGAASAQQSAPAANQTPVTFTKDVAPILQRSCQTCHRPGAVAPMSLLTYEDARPWARSIKTKVTAREMPPWHIDRNIGITKFKDDPSLTDAEIATIAKWVDAGAPMGNPGRHAAAPAVQRSRSVVHRQARHHRDVGQAVRPAGRGPRQHRRHAGRSGVQGRHVHDGHREQAGRPGELQGHASLHDEPGRGSGRGSDRTLPERIRARQERRHLPAELGPPGQGGHARSTSTCTSIRAARRRR